MTEDLPESAKETRRRQILMAALNAFAEKGYDKTSMDDIVRVSGLSKGTLYWYFNNKQALFAALVKMVIDSITEAVEQAAHDSIGLTPPERLRAMIAGAVPVGDDNARFIGLYADFFTQAWQHEIVQEAFRTAYDRYVALVVQVVQDGIDAGHFRPVDTLLAARAVVGAVDSIFLQELLNMGGIERVLDVFGDMMLRGLLKGGDHAG